MKTLEVQTIEGPKTLKEFKTFGKYIAVNHAESGLPRHEIGYNVTHIPSGRMLVPCETEKEAFFWAEKISTNCGDELGHDVSSVDDLPSFTKNYLKEIRFGKEEYNDET